MRRLVPLVVGAIAVVGCGDPDPTVSSPSIALESSGTTVPTSTIGATSVPGSSDSTVPGTAASPPGAPFDCSTLVDGLPTMLIGADDAAGRCDEIVAAAQRWTEMGTGMHGVTRVVLKPGQEELAAELAARYGPLVELHVGNFPFDPDTGAVEGDLCEELPDDTARAELSVDDARRVGDAVLFDITNDGTSTVHVVPERIAELTDVDGNRTVTAFTGAMTAEARPSSELPPRGTDTVRGELSLAACDPSTGTALQPGSYDATLVIRVFDEPSGEGEPSTEILIARHTIAIP